LLYRKWVSESRTEIKLFTFKESAHGARIYRYCSVFLSREAGGTQDKRKGKKGPEGGREGEDEGHRKGDDLVLDKVCAAIVDLVWATMNKIVAPSHTTVKNGDTGIWDGEGTSSVERR